jgi:hypothetical protein
MVRNVVMDVVGLVVIVDLVVGLLFDVGGIRMDGTQGGRVLLVVGFGVFVTA